MDRNPHKLDEIRIQRSEIENHYIDELLAACGGANNSSSASSGAASAPVKRGGVLRVANQVPAAAMNPLTVADGGGIIMLGQTGEFLITDNTGRTGQPLQPTLALSWRPNADATVWTFYRIGDCVSPRCSATSSTTDTASLVRSTPPTRASHFPTGASSRSTQQQPGHPRPFALRMRH